MKITFTTFILELSFSSDEKNKRIVEVEAGNFYSNKEKSQKQKQLKNIKQYYKENKNTSFKFKYITLLLLHFLQEQEKKKNYHIYEI